MTTETPIHAAFVEHEDPLLRLALGACRLRVSSGGSEPWVTGVYRDPSGAQPLQQHLEGNELTIGQSRSFSSTLGLLRGAPSCELRLGTGRPFRLRIETGASEIDLDLGGVPLRGLHLRSGAGKVSVRARQANPVEAESVVLRIGAGALETVGLGNLAASSLQVDSGAAGVVLDLTGELRRPLDARISSGMSGVRVILPSDRPARVTTETTLGGTDLGDGFVTRDGAVFTAAEGEPVLTLHAAVSFGGLQLRTAALPS